MKDHAQRQYELMMNDKAHISNKLAVALMLSAFVLPNLIFMVIG